VQRQVPLLRTGPLVAVERAVHADARAVVVVGADERRRRELARGKAVLEQEGRLEAAERAAERRVLDEAVLRDPGTPPRVEGPVVEDAPAGTDKRLGIHRVGDTQARREGLLVGLLRVVGAVARRAVVGARKGQAARTSSRPGIRAVGIEEGEDVVLLL